MNNLDTGILIISSSAVVLTGAWLFIRHDFQATGSFRIGRRNPPQPKAPRAAEQVAPVTDISKGAAA